MEVIANSLAGFNHSKYPWGSTDTTAIRDALKNVEIDGVTGNITFNETGDANKDIAFIKTIKDGRFQFLTTTTVE